MASAVKTIHTIDGPRQCWRAVKQGRRPVGLGAPVLVRLYAEDLAKIEQLSARLGMYWNLNQFIREAVREKLANSVYTELVKT